MLQTLKNRRQAGFTLVELLIVIVVIAILAAIVITTFSGVQARARDTERQTDMKAVASQLEVYYTNEGHYPQLSVLTTTSTATSTLKGLSADALADPVDSTDNSFQGTAATAGGQYGYVVSDPDCATDATQCQDFTLSYWSEAKEGGAGVVTVKSLTN